MALILDTNALSAAAEHEAAALEVFASSARLAVPVIVLGEYRFGIALSRHRANYEDWLRAWLAAVTVLAIDEETTHHYAAIALELRKMGKPIPPNDVWIAALCRQHGLPLISRDQHFDVVPGIQRFSW